MKGKTRAKVEFIVLTVIILAIGALLGMFATVICYEVRAGHEYQEVTRLHLEMYRAASCRGCHE